MNSWQVAVVGLGEDPINITVQAPNARAAVDKVSALIPGNGSGRAMFIAKEVIP